MRPSLLSATYLFLGLIAFELGFAMPLMAGPGTIETWAGTGGLHDGALATDAALGNPMNCALDAQGDLYIVDNNQGVVRRVDAVSGIISTVAGRPWATPGYDGDGGPATSALLNRPQDLALNAAGDLYICDTWNSSIRRVNATSGIIERAAGDPAKKMTYVGDGGPATAAGLSFPYGITFGPGGDLFIADTAAAVIRRVNALTGVISTFAGDHSGPGYVSGDGGPATAATFDGPVSLAFNAANDLFVGESYLVRRIDALSNSISTYAGSPGVRYTYTGDGGPAVAAGMGMVDRLCFDSSGDLYLADTDNSVIRKVDAATHSITTVAGVGGWIAFNGDGLDALSSMLRWPTGVAMGAGGKLYFCDSDNHRVRLLDPATKTLSTVAGNGRTEESGDGGPARGAQLRPNRLARNAVGELFFSDSVDHVVRKIDAAGVISTVAGNTDRTLFYPATGDGGPGDQAGLNTPNGIAVNAQGDLFIADTNHMVIRKVDGATGKITRVAGTYGSVGYSGDGGPAISATLNYPNAVAVDAAGNLYIGDTLNDVVRKVDVGGTITTFAGDHVAGYSGDGGPAISAHLSRPFGLACDVDGNVYIGGQGALVRMVDPSGVITTVAGQNAVGYSGDGGPATAAKLIFPRDLWVSPQGDLYIADLAANNIRRVDAVSKRISTVAGDYSLGAGLLGDGGPATAARLNGPTGLVGDANGTLYIADQGNRRIRQVEGSGAGFTPTRTFSASPTPSLTRTFSLTPTRTPSLTASNSPTATLTATRSATPTLTPSFTASPSSPPTPPFPVSGQGFSLLAPVPLRQGQALCLYYRDEPLGAEVELFNLAGERVASLHFGGGYDHCWKTPHLGAGLYFARITVHGASGDERRTQKLAVLP